MRGSTLPRGGPASPGLYGISPQGSMDSLPGHQASQGILGVKSNIHERKGSMPPPQYQTPNKANLLSPSAVVAGARQEIGFPSSCKNNGPLQKVFANTQQHGEIGAFSRNLEIIGQKKNEWANPSNTQKNKIGGDLTVRDVVDNVLRIPAFGF